MTAGDAGEHALTRAVGFINRVANRAFPAGVSWIHEYQGDAKLFCLVRDKGPELSESPVVEFVPMAASGLNPVLASDTPEFFEGDVGLGALRCRYYSFADDVVRVLLEPSLLAFQTVKFTFRGFGTVLLKVGSAVRVAAAHFLDLAPAIAGSFGVKGQVDYAQVNSQDAFGFDVAGIGNVADACDVPLAVDQHQVNFTFAMFQQGPLSITADKRYRLASTQQPNRDHVVFLEAEDAVIVGLRGVGTEAACLGSGPNFVCVSDLGGAAHNYLSRKIELGFYIIVEQFLKVVLAEGFLSQTFSSNPVARVVAGIKRSLQEKGLLWRGLQLDVCYKFHISIIENCARMSTSKVQRHGIPPHPRGVGLPAVGAA